MTPEEIDAHNNEMVRAYRLCFGSPAGQVVMKDLVPFCRAAGTTFGDPEFPIEYLEGRRSVFLRIQNFMNLMPAELVMLARGLSIRQGASDA